MTLLSPWLSPQGEAALLGGAFIAIGWVVNGRQNRRRDADLRTERVRDVQRALYAEIRAHLAVLKRDNIATYGAGIAGRIEKEPGYFPVIPTEQNATVFSAILTEIHVLPRPTVDPVVLYYSQLAVIGAMIGDLRALDLERIGAVRAAAMYRDYIAMKVQALELGDEALAVMRLHLDGGAVAVRKAETARDLSEADRLRAEAPLLRADIAARQARLNSPASDPFAR